MSVVYSDTGNAVICSGSYMYLANGMTIQSITLPTYVVDKPDWIDLSTPIQGMAIDDKYIYTVRGDAKIILIDLYDDGFPGLWATVGNELKGICISGGYAYVTNWVDSTSEIIQVNLAGANVVSTVKFENNVKPFQICVLGDYLYTANETDSYISRIDLTNNTITEQWCDISNYSTYIAAYGNYIYVTANKTGSNMNPYTIFKVSLDGTTVTTFDTTYNSGYLYVYNEQLYALTTAGVVMFEISPATETLVYSQDELDASSTETATGTRGTAMLRRPGKRRPVAIIEMITRASIVKRRRRTIHTTHHDCTITFLQHSSAISGKFLHVNNTGVLSETVTCMSHAASGRYTSAKLTITPNGNMREITVTP
jgi:hypothetical protein